MKNSTKIALGLLVVGLIASIPLSSKSETDKVKENKKIVLSADNTIVLSDPINGDSVSKIIVKANQMDNSLLSKVGMGSKKHIYLFLRTPGGEIQSGLELLETLKGLNRPVDTITMFAASMGFQTAQQLGKRYIVRNGVLMSHRAKGGFEGEFGGMRPSQVDSRKGLWESRIDELDAETVRRTEGKQTMESYQRAYASELWVTGTQAVAQGYADEVVTVSCDPSLSGTSTKTINYMGLIELDYDVDNCPLDSTPMNVRPKMVTNKGIMSMNDFLAANGEFGSACLMAAGVDTKKVCASNTSLTLEKVIELKDSFSGYYMDIKNRTISLKI